MKHVRIEHHEYEITLEPLTRWQKLFIAGVFFFLLIVVPFLLALAGTLDDCSRRGLSMRQCYEDVRRSWREGSFVVLILIVGFLSVRDWLKRIHNATCPVKPFERMREGLEQGLREGQENKDKLSLKDGCPDCHQFQFYNGPEGGACTNVCCANPNCRSAFNVGPGYVERIPNTTFLSAFPGNPGESPHYKGRD